MALLSSALDRYFGLFVPQLNDDGAPSLVRHTDPPAAIPCPTTGRALKVSTVESRARAICPACETTAEGGFVSFVGDLRLAYACPSCEQVVWLEGA
ncbi:MAG: hypothetical protein IT178_12405 [Acidobacteria bacterium]|nr:hypothetical protein [Acidobacteriota bacterium]